MKLRQLLLLSAASLAWGSNAQTTWRMAYGAFAADEGRSIQVTADEEVVVAGSSASFSPGSSDIYLFKLDGDGAMVWSRTIGGPQIERANDLLAISDGGWLLVGSTNDVSGAGGYDGLLIRTDSEGQVLWRRQYGGADWDFFQSGLLLGDGGFALVGQTFSQGTNGDVWLVRTDDQGDTLWTSHYGGPGLDEGWGIAETSDGGLVLAGSRTSANGDLDAYLLKLDAQHVIQWEHVYGGDSLDIARDVVATQDGGYSIVGSTRSFSQYTEHYHARLDASGTLQWQRNWGQVNDQEAFHHVELPIGGFATTGWTTTSGGGGKDMFIHFCDEQGDFLSQRTFGGGDDDAGFAIARMPDGFVACGSTFSYGSGNSDVFVVRTGIDGATASEAVSSFFDPLSAPSLRLVGRPFHYPNPTSGIIGLEGSTAWARMGLFDLQGRELMHWSAPPARIDVSSQPSGTYLLRAIDHAGNMACSPLILNKP